MDLIFTDSQRVEVGVFPAYALDLSFGAKENDFEITLADDYLLEYGAYIYFEGTEYGGIVDGLKARTDSRTITYCGRTWHGMLNSKVIEPDSGAAYLTVSGEANEVIGAVLTRLGLDDLFTASETASGITISNYQFARYIKGYDGLAAMLKANGAKLKLSWENKKVLLSAEPVRDYRETPLDDDDAVLDIERYQKTVNHLICLGKGELTERQIVHLYTDESGNIGTQQYYTGVDEITDIYENVNAEDITELTEGGEERFATLRSKDKAEVSVPEIDGIVYDIGDIVGARHLITGISVSATISQKIVKIQNGSVKIEHQAGG